MIARSSHPKAPLTVRQLEMLGALRRWPKRKAALIRFAGDGNTLASLVQRGAVIIYLGADGSFTCCLTAAGKRLATASKRKAKGQTHEHDHDKARQQPLDP